MADKGVALQFLQCFPEAVAFNVTLLTEERRHVLSLPQCSRPHLLQNLGTWLGMTSCHFFIRPHMANLIMVDLDNYTGQLEAVLALKPRALVCTSPGNYQAWLKVTTLVHARTALRAPKEEEGQSGDD